MNPGTVLIVEDDLDLREELADFLTEKGYSVRGVGSIAEAELVLAEPFDLMVLDINLPDGNGLELCQRLRPYLRSGIVICTGRSERDLKIRGLKDGADAYLIKPVDPEELEATLASVQRRVSNNDFSVLQPAPLPVQWRLDRPRQMLTAPNGSVVKLSAGEVLMLARVLDDNNQHASRIALLSAFKAAGTPTDGRRLEALASRLRCKVLNKIGLQLPLQSVYGKGYVFSDHADLI